MIINDYWARYLKRKVSCIWIEYFVDVMDTLLQDILTRYIWMGHLNMGRMYG